MITPMDPTSASALDQAVSELYDARNRFARTSIHQRIQMLQTLRTTYPKVAQRWVSTAHEAKGLPEGSPGRAEDWLGGPLLVNRNLRMLQASLEYFAANGKPYLPSKRHKSDVCLSCISTKTETSR